MKKLLILALVLGSAQLATAQGGGPGSTGPTPTPLAQPTAVPLDGGASLLLAGGVALGLRKLRQRRQKAA